jgi:hypothetical protein
MSEKQDKEQKKSVDRSDYFLATPADFIFHGKRDKKED